MSVETTVLLLTPQRLPPGLEEELSRRDVFFEEAADEDVDQVLPVLTPDLIIRASGPGLESLLERLEGLAGLEGLEQLPPLIVVVDRSQFNELRRKNHRAIAALIPSDIAPAAVAHRIATMAKRSAEGKPIVAASTTPTKERSPPAPRPPPPNPPLAAPPASRPPSPDEKGLRSIRIERLEAQAGSFALKSTKSQRPGPAERLANTRDTLRAAAAPPMISESPPLANSLEPGLPPQGPPPKAAAPEFSVLIPLPVSTRETLSGEESAVQKVRLALLDTDLTRADALVFALRERGVLVHPLTPDPVGTRWPLLRRFAPQGLVVDEKSLTRGSAEWVERFRGDPFLRHVPLIVLRFSRLFRDEKAEVTLDPLLKAIEHLGKEEFALLDKLRPGRQVDLALGQVTPLRLVALLTSEDRNTRLDCRGDGDRMVWHLGPGYAGKAKVLRLEDGKIIAQLSPEEALSWLINHEDCHVSVHEHTEPLAHASESKDVLALMEEMTAAMAPPERHQSVRPGSRIVPLKDSAPPALPPPERAVEPAAIDEQVATVPFQENSLIRRLDAWTQRLQSRLATFPIKIPDEGLRALIVAAPLLVLLLLGLAAALLLGGGENQEEHGPEKNTFAREKALNDAAVLPQTAEVPPKSPSIPKSPDKLATESEGKAETNLFFVAPDSGLASCETKLGKQSPQEPSVERSSSYYRQARSLLMKGESEEAWKMMCFAGLLYPTGPAARGLAEFYLARRSLAEAERWAQRAIEGPKPQRQDHELFGDVKNQQGQVGESRKLWLETMKLSGGEDAKLKVIARNHTRNAQKFRQAGDLPRAEIEARRAVTLADDASAATEFAEVLLKRDVLQAASKWVDQARKIDPFNHYSLLVGGRIAEAQKDPKKARRLYAEIPNNDAHYREAQSRLSRL